MPQVPPATQNEPEVLSAAPATQNGPEMPQVPPATQNEPEVLQVLRLPRKTGQRPNASPDGGPRTSVKVLQVLRLPRKRAADAPSAALATQNEAAPIRITCRGTSADPYESAPNAAPAKQDGVVLMLLC